MDSRVTLALNLMEQQFTRRLSITSLARQLGCSPSALRSLFKRDVGMSPRRYLKALRLTTAAELLTTGEMSVKEVAAATGCGDVSHFVRDFEAHYGRSPRNYRIKARAQLVNWPANLAKVPILRARDEQSRVEKFGQFE
jgi:transcriptional regulator GlxA family with amidase domain